MTTSTNYKIVQIKSFEQAQQYGEYTNNWCVCYHLDDYKAYAFGKRMFFCLKDGYQNIEMKESAGFPQDEYGLSMLMIVINNNEMTYASTRWNDILMNLTVEKIEEILDVDFNETFLK